jgi:hypothetical protein
MTRSVSSEGRALYSELLGAGMWWIEVKSQMLTPPQLGVDVDRGNRVSCPLALLTYGLVSGHRAHL